MQESFIIVYYIVYYSCMLTVKRSVVKLQPACRATTTGRMRPDVQLQPAEHRGEKTREGAISGVGLLERMSAVEV
jgi:hypothetical protein